MKVDRSSVYGPFEEGIAVEAKIMALLVAHHSTINISMSMINQVRLSKVVLKLVRLAYTPEHKDSWDDISSYSEQISNTLKEQDIAKD